MPPPSKGAPRAPPEKKVSAGSAPAARGLAAKSTPTRKLTFDATLRLDVFDSYAEKHSAEKTVKKVAEVYSDAMARPREASINDAETLTGIPQAVIP